VALPNDLLHSSMHLICHKGKTAFHGYSIPFCFKHKYRCCFKLNFIYMPTRYVMNFTRAEGQQLTSIDSYATYVHARARPHRDDRTFGTPYTGCIGFKSRTLARLSCLNVIVGFLSLSGQMQGFYLKQGHNRCVPRPLPFSIRSPSDMLQTEFLVALYIL
jgi:hypothetical protein